MWTWVALLFARSLVAATINIVATSINGSPLTPEIRLLQLGSSKNIWPALHQQKAFDIPPGYYQLDASFPGYAVYHRSIEVYDNQNDFRIVLNPSSEGVRRLELKGRIENAVSPASLWVLLLPLAGSPEMVAEGRVDVQGRFAVATTRSGTYVLVVAEGGSALQCRAVSVGIDNPLLVIDLKTSK